jgi:hypothetical protein
MFAGWTTANRAALALLLASATLCAAEAAGARRLEPLPSSVRAATPKPMPRIVVGGGGGDGAVLAAVARDPFRADRRRPPGRLPAPGTPVPAAPAHTPAAAPSPAMMLRLMGTVVLPNGGLAVVAGADGEGRILRVGQEMAGYKLVRVGPGTATMAGGDTTVVLRTAGAAQ